MYCNDSSLVFQVSLLQLSLLVFLQFFHQYKHNVGRRGRWSKIDYALEVFNEMYGEGVITADMIHLSDDSSDNTNDCVSLVFLS